MKTADIVIIGGGMVGLTLAALLAESGCQIKIIEKNGPNTVQNSIRVSAINRASQQILIQSGAWQALSDHLSAYEQMFVWEKDSFAHIHFDHKDAAIKQLNLAQLGFIIENNRIQHALWDIVSRQPNIELILSSPKEMAVNENGALLILDNGAMISTKLVVGADGANSWVRNQCNIPLISRDYQHRALICNVKTDEPHNKTARQVFDSDSILAFLPLTDEHLCAIIWSLPPDKAEELVQSDEETFNKALNIAFDNRLGQCHLQTLRGVYPLVARYARDFARERVALIGDAAHTIHPLAGLGLNSGLADAGYLAQQIKQHLVLGNDIGELRHLRHFERVRKVEAVKLLVSMEGIKQLFSGNHPLKKLVRGVGLSFVHHNRLLKKFLIAQAAGI